ncbi:Omega-amidase nit3 [Exophiala xenobiotica]|uniref:Omega-amidase nit3 n=1 Tax=Lithohypha guttulata TaxID=1690604 RepID=A0ABR0KHB4_9EURO|nr:Omega-amidase nit3 [Lithohypha guttulata]KAK5327160.1 Omega-amidase nit3 [Exophiala xenobiotica]
MSTLLKKNFKVGLIQLAAGSDKQKNLAKARGKILEAAKAGAQVIVLPECFNSPYGCQYFPDYAEPIEPSPPSEEQSPSWNMLSSAAKETNTYVVGASIPELSQDKKTYYNTAFVFNPKGELLATHRKTHLFDIDIPGKIKFIESDVLSAGNKVTIVDLPDYGKIGLAICYDVRFPEMAMVAARKGAFMLVYPGAFNTTTGPMHWTLQARARAMDNQVYVAMCSPARDTTSTYHAYGHSMVVNPNADVITELEEKEDIAYADIDGSKIDEIRKGVPLYTQRRFDVYPDVSAGKVRYEE